MVRIFIWVFIAIGVTKTIANSKQQFDLRRLLTSVVLG